MKTNFKKVIEFNTCFNHKVSNEPYIKIFDNEPKLVIQRLALIEEEINELKEAYDNNDIVEIIDALSDILYVAYGFCVCFGINIDEKFSEYMHLYLKENKVNKVIKVGNVSMEKLNSLTNYHKTQYIITMLDDVKKYHINIKNNMYKTNLDMIMSYITEHFDNLTNSCNESNFQNITFDIFNVLKNTYLFGNQIGLDLDKSFTIVHDSNMTKICDTEELAIETVNNYKQNDNRYDSPSYKLTKFGYVIFNESTEKILKSIKYTPANFESLLN
jgi:predicted HAD superfamily Cof-like phosphohydrolase